MHEFDQAKFTGKDCFHIQYLETAFRYKQHFICQVNTMICQSTFAVAAGRKTRDENLLTTANNTKRIAKLYRTLSIIGFGLTYRQLKTFIEILNVQN